MTRFLRQRLVQASALFLGVVAFSLALAVAPSLAQTPLTLDLAVTDTTINPQTGQVTIRGTVTCSEPASYQVGINVTQYVGRTSTIIGSGSTTGTCPGPQGSTFTVVVFGSTGRFGPGQARIDAFLSGCAVTPYPSPYPFPECDSDQETLTTRLRPSR